ncbi:MAG: hypothetical protein GX825_09550 [Syntrophomonadaceae bacterium]|nr:hypothetical protein [Syntrophomonadaceae bacterium]
MKSTGKVLLLAVLLLGFLGFKQLSPLLARVEANQRVIASLEQHLHREMPEENVRLRQENARLGEQIPDQAKNAEMIIILTKLAEKHNLQQLAIKEERWESIINPEDDPVLKLSANTFIWRGSGAFQDIQAFFADLEKIERLVLVSKLEMTLAGDIWNLTFHLTTYYN